MSTKGKRMANNSDNKKNINSEELYDNANSENYKYVNQLMTAQELDRLQDGLVYEMPKE